MKKITIIMFLGLWAILSTPVCRAEKAYVMNPSKITLRTGPSTQDKIINMLNQDTPVEILETQSGWSRVRLLGDNRRNVEGWVVGGFLTSDVPWKDQVAALKEENARLKKRAESIEKEWSASSGEKELMSEKLEKAENELKDVRRKYQSLKRDSGTLLELQAAHAKTLKAFREARDTLEALQKENLVMKSTQRNIWFITGAAVLLVGLLFGLVMGRQQRKRKSAYY